MSEESLYSTKNNIVARDLDVIDLSVVINHFLKNWLVILSSVVIGIVICFLIYISLPTKWKATATLKIGSMPIIDVGKDVAKFELIESPDQAIAKLRLNNNLEKIIGFAEDGKPQIKIHEQERELIKRTFNVDMIKNTNSVQIATTALSNLHAERVVSSASQILLDSHQKRFAKALTSLEEKKQGCNEKIVELKTEKMRLQALLAGMEKLKSSSQFAPTIVAISLLENKQTELNNLVQQCAVLEDKIGSLNNFPTSVVDPVHAELAPYFPKTGWFLVIGGIAGLLFGLIISLFINFKKSRQSVDA